MHSAHISKTTDFSDSDGRFHLSACVIYLQNKFRRVPGFFRYVPFICSQGTTYISKTNFATVFYAVPKVQCFSKPRPAIVVNVCCISQKPNSLRAWFLRYVPDTNAFFNFCLRDLFELVSSLANSSNFGHVGEMKTKLRH